MNEEAVKIMPASAQINREVGLKLLYQMLLIRKFEEKSAEMYTKEKIRGFMHLYSGQEAVAVGVMQALTPEDNVLTTYRDHGQALARGMEAKKIMAELYGKMEGCTGGRGGSMHLFDVKKKFFGGSAIAGGHLPMSVGLALASKKQKINNITCSFFGEGAMAEGEFHESMNLAALWQVPLLMVCENNLYAMGTAINYTHSVQDLEKKGAAYAIESFTVNGMDVLEVEKASKYAVERIKATGKPYFLVCNTYRFRAHSMFDAELYRSKNEVEEWKKRDPIIGLSNYLTEQKIITENDIKGIESNVKTEIQQAVEYAENGTWEPVEQLTKFIYHE